MPSKMDARTITLVKRSPKDLFARFCQRLGPKHKPPHHGTCRSALQPPLRGSWLTAPNRETRCCTARIRLRILIGSPLQMVGHDVQGSLIQIHGHLGKKPGDDECLIFSFPLMFSFFFFFSIGDLQLGASFSFKNQGPRSKIQIQNPIQATDLLGTCQETDQKPTKRLVP